MVFEQKLSKEMLLKLITWVKIKPVGICDSGQKFNWTKLDENEMVQIQTLIVIADMKKSWQLPRNFNKLKKINFLFQWKGINRKQSTRWQHLSRLKASVFFSLQFF